MDCKQAFEQMNLKLDGYQINEVDFESHLSGCAQCRSRYASFMTIHDACEDAEMEEVPASLRSGLQYRVRKEDKASKFKFMSLGRFGYAAAAVVVGVLIWQFYPTIVGPEANPTNGPVIIETGSVPRATLAPFDSKMNSAALLREAAQPVVDTITMGKPVADEAMAIKIGESVMARLYGEDHTHCLPLAAEYSAEADMWTVRGAATGHAGSGVFQLQMNGTTGQVFEVVHGK